MWVSPCVPGYSLGDNYVNDDTSIIELGRYSVKLLVKPECILTGAKNGGTT